MEFKRKIYDKLLEWKRSSAGRSALMVDGARRVGKSFIVEAFAKREYRSYLLIDFNRPRPGAVEAITEESNDLDFLFAKLAGAVYRMMLLYRGGFPKPAQLIRMLRENRSAAHTDAGKEG